MLFIYSYDSVMKRVVTIDMISSVDSNTAVIDFKVFRLIDYNMSNVLREQNLRFIYN